MMKNTAISVMMWFVFAVLMPTVSFAYYHPKEPFAKDQIEPTRLIVKLRADVRPILSHPKGGAVGLGIAAFDMVNKRFKVTEQSWLYPTATEQYRPDPLRNVFIISVPDGVDIQQMQAHYENLDVVVYAHPDRRLELYDNPNDPLYPHQWALNNTGQGYYHVLRRDGDYNDTLVIEYGVDDADIDAQEVFDNPPDNTLTVIVAIIDTGVDLDHPDLTDRIWTNPGEIAGNGLDDDHNGYIDDVQGWDFDGDGLSFPLEEDNDPTDGHGHGTHCAGIVTAVANNAQGVAGITADCRIMALNFAPVMLSSFGAKAIIYAADNGADIISMSWGYPWPVQVLEDALEYARMKGVILCAAAGNDGVEFSNYPAACPGVITVGATTSSDEVTSFSTLGEHLEISAPGLSILSLRADLTDMYARYKEPDVHIIENNYYLASGTSMACPHVAGVAAYMRAVSPGLTPDSAQEILQISADDIIDPYGTGDNYPGWDIYSGYGRVNLHNALDSVPLLRAKIQTPLTNEIVSDLVEISGVADGDSFSNYVLEFGFGSVPISWQEIHTSSIPVTGGILGEWNTSGLNGQYTIRLRVGESNISSVTVYVANITAASILIPSVNDTIVSWTEVVGTAISPDFGYYLLEYGTGASPSAWYEIVEISMPVFEDELAAWNTGALSDGLYTLRLSVYSSAGQEEASDSVLVYVQSPFSPEYGWRLSFDDIVVVVPNYGDFDNDGINEIVVGTNKGIEFFNPDGTPKTTEVPAVPNYDFRIPPAVGDLNNDGIDDLVAIGISATSVDTTARLLGFPSGEAPFEVDLVRFPRGLSNCWQDDYLWPSVFLRDIDGDGRDEIHCYPGPKQGGQFMYYVYNADGSFRIGLPPTSEMQNSGYCYLPADVDGDGSDEFYFAVIAVSDTVAPMLYQSDLSGVVQDSFCLEVDSVSDFSSQALSAVDMDNDGQLELIVFGYVGASLGQWWTYAFDEGLALKPGWPQRSGIDNYLVPSVPLFGDMDGDGIMEYFVTVFELSFGFACAWHVDGSPYAGGAGTGIFASTPNPAKLYSPIIADMDGDWFPDLVAGAEPDVLCTYDIDRIIAWDRNAELLAGWPLVTEAGGGTCYMMQRHTPVAGDIDGDGYVDLIMTNSTNDLVFVNFEGTYFHAQTSPAPFWRYNRRLNNVGPISDTAWVCGDVDGNSAGPNVADLSYLVDYLFFGGTPPPVMEAANVDGEGGINVADLTYLVDYLFFGGPEPICGPIE
jgi:subtilisin family serine protease